MGAHPQSGKEPVRNAFDFCYPHYSPDLCPSGSLTYFSFEQLPIFPENSFVLPVIQKVFLAYLQQYPELPEIANLALRYILTFFPRKRGRNQIISEMRIYNNKKRNFINYK